MKKELRVYDMRFYIMQICEEVSSTGGNGQT